MLSWLLWTGCTPVDPSAVDEDGDGWLADDDCDDLDPSVHPDVAWDPGADGVDQDCDGYEGMGTLDATDLPFQLLGPTSVRLSGVWDLCDTNLDGIDDLVVLEGDEDRTSSGRLFVYHGPLVGTRLPDSFDQEVPFQPVRYGTLHCADVDGDSAPDVVLARSSITTILYSAFGSSPTASQLSGFMGKVVVADFDGDARADVVGQRTSPNTWWWLPGARYPALVSSNGWPGHAIDSRTEHHVLDDLDNDGDAELAVRIGLETWVMDHPLDPAPVQALNHLSSGTMTAGDFDGDGSSDDVLVGEREGELRFGVDSLLDDELAPGIEIATPTFDATPHNLGDIDGDGVDDPLLIDIDTEEGALHLYLLESIALTDPSRDRLHLVTRFDLQMRFAEPRIASWRAGDIDGDGRTDLLLGRGPEVTEEDGPIASFYGWLSSSAQGAP